MAGQNTIEHSRTIKFGKFLRNVDILPDRGPRTRKSTTGISPTEEKNIAAKM